GPAGEAARAEPQERPEPPAAACAESAVEVHRRNDDAVEAAGGSGAAIGQLRGEPLISEARRDRGLRFPPPWSVVPSRQPEDDVPAHAGDALGAAPAERGNGGGVG